MRLHNIGLDAQPVRAVSHARRSFQSLITVSGKMMWSAAPVSSTLNSPKVAHLDHPGAAFVHPAQFFERRRRLSPTEGCFTPEGEKAAKREY
jgi:hypothetical protein